MQFIECGREALLKPLTVVGGIIEGRQTLPILANILVEKEGDDLTFTTTDLDIQIKTHAKIGFGPDSLKATIPASKFISILSALPKSEENLSVDIEGKKIVLHAQTGRFTLAQLNADEYPSLPEIVAGKKFQLPASALKYILQMVHFAMAQQDIRYYLNGLLLVVDSNMVRTVATDGHRLACCDANCEIALDAPFEVILPRKAVLQLMKLLPDSDELIDVEIGKEHARFSFGDIEFLAKLIDGKFPDYTRVIPKNNDKMFLVNRENLIGALRRVAILANEKFKGLRWLVTNGNLQIQSVNSDMEEAVENISIDYTGEELDLGFNVTYLLDVLSNLRNTDVRFSFSSSQSASLLTMPESEQFRYVLMPMRI